MRLQSERALNSRASARRFDGRSHGLADGPQPRLSTDFTPQCDMSVGTVIVFSISRDTPPRIPSCSRECP